MRALIAGLLLLASAGAAAAADVQEPYPDVEPARFGWDGAYVGGSIGYAWLDDIDYQFTPPLPDKGEDVIFGLHAGYNWQLGNLVFGAEVEAQRLDITYEFLDFITIDNAFAAKARAGYAFDRYLVTAHGGGVYATTNYMGLKDWGWTAGAGIDYAFTDNITLGAQYNHYEFKEFDGTQIDATIDLVTARVGLKF